MALADTEDAALNEFLIAFGCAILAWQHVEHTLFICFYKLRLASVKDTTIESAGVVFYAEHLFSGKLEVVNGVCKTVLDEADLAKWMKLKQVLRSGARNRNALAHLTLQSEGRMGAPTTHALAPQMFVPLSMRIPRKRIDAKECDRLRSTFEAIGLRVSAFCAP